MNPLFEHLKAVIEGVPGLPRWRGWFAEHETALAEILSRGQVVRLRHHPNKEIPELLRQRHIPFTPSTYYEWLDADSTSGRCRDCGAQLQGTKAGDTWIWCPNGCFRMEAHHPPRTPASA